MAQSSDCCSEPNSIYNYDALVYMYDGTAQYVLSTHKFTGKERDNESGLDNFGARYDSSQYGRFMTPDPVTMNALRLINPQRLNLYSYSINNPITYFDPDGRDAALVTFGGMVGGLGHDGLLSIHSDGTARFAEYGPVNHSAANAFGAVAPGKTNVDSIHMPKVQFGADGKPTADSLKALQQAIAKYDEGGIDPNSITITYIKTSEAETTSLDNFFADFANGHYTVYSHNCANFCRLGLAAAGVADRSESSIVPNILAMQVMLVQMAQNQPTRAQLHELVSSRICRGKDANGNTVCN